VTQEPTAGPGGRVVVLLSGSGTLLQSLLDATRGGDAGFAVVAAVADRADAHGLTRARAAGLPTAVVAPADFPDRATWDVALERAVRTFKPDLVVMAGFMRIVGVPMLDRYGGRLVNTHPALLPAFPGAHAVRDALAHGVKVSGCSVILVDAGTDTGPIVAQRAVDVLDGDDEGALHERIKVVERELLVDVVGRMCRHGWTVDDRKVVLA
jgi:phosphoribosylglycinamide formyltransferase-1